MTCSTCQVKDYGGDGKLVPVWENIDDYERGEGPDYLGCTECNTMRPVEEEASEKP